MSPSAHQCQNDLAATAFRMFKTIWHVAGCRGEVSLLGRIAEAATCGEYQLRHR